MTAWESSGSNNELCFYFFSVLCQPLGEWCGDFFQITCTVDSPRGAVPSECSTPWRNLHMRLLSWLKNLQEIKHKGSGAWMNIVPYFKHTPFEEADVREICSTTYNHSAIMSDCFTNCPHPPFRLRFFFLREADVNGCVCEKERASQRERKRELSQVTLSFRNPEGLADSRLQHGHHKSMGEGAKLIARHLWRRKAWITPKALHLPRGYGVMKGVEQGNWEEGTAHVGREQSSLATISLHWSVN